MNGIQLTVEHLVQIKDEIRQVIFITTIVKNAAVLTGILDCLPTSSVSLL